MKCIGGDADIDDAEDIFKKRGSGDKLFYIVYKGNYCSLRQWQLVLIGVRKYTFLMF